MRLLLLFRRRLPAAQTERRRRGRWAAVLLVTALMGLQTLFGTPAMADPLQPDCAEAPPLERPGDGAVGSIDPPQGNGEKDSLYLNYGYAGFRWNTYDQHVGPVCNDGFAGVTTLVGNGIFDIAKILVGATNSLHYSLKNGGFIGGFDAIVEKGSAALYSGAAVPYLAFGLVLVAVAMFWYALRGDMAATSKATGRVLVGLWVMAATALTPLLYATLTDSVLVSGVNELEANIYRQVDGNGDVAYRDVLPTLLHRKIVVENWARGEFGNYETDFAKQTTPRLVDAQAWNWNDIRTGGDADDNAEKAKQAEFKKIAEEVKQNANYAAFNGDGAHRIGASFFALGQALCMVLFQLICKVAIVLAQLVLRMAILAGPIIGLLAFAPGVARTLARAILGVLAQGLILSAAAAVHGLVMVWLVDSTAFGGRFGNLVMMFVVTIVLWAVLKPWRRLKNMAGAAVGIPALSRDTLRLEQLLKKQFRQDGRGWWNRIKRAGRGLDKLGHRTVDTPRNWPGEDTPPRPETVWTDAEVMRDRPQRAGGDLTRSHRGGSPPRPDTVWADAEVVRGGTAARTSDAYRRPELVTARAGLPPGGGAGGRAEDDGTRGRGPGRGPDGSGTGGGGVRAESSDTAHGLPRVVDGDVVVPSDLETRERWMAAERSETRDDAPPSRPEPRPRKRVKPQVYRPSTGRVEDDSDRDRPRPESPEHRNNNDDEGGT